MKTGITEPHPSIDNIQDEAAKKLWTAYLPKAPYPETELEIFTILEGLGGLLFFEQRLVRKGDITSDEKHEQFLSDLRAIQQHLLNQLFEHHNIIAPEDSPKRSEQAAVPAPEGKKYYWSWYDEIKIQYYKEVHKNIICSGCVFSKGFKDMVQFGGGVPCGVIDGLTKNSLIRRDTCDFETDDHILGLPLLEYMREKKGDKAVSTYQKKQEELKEIQFATIKVPLPIRVEG